jgi:hypothetical protein
LTIDQSEICERNAEASETGYVTRFLNFRYVAADGLARFSDDNAVYHERLDEGRRKWIAHLVFLRRKHLVDANREVGAGWNRQACRDGLLVLINRLLLLRIALWRGTVVGLLLAISRIAALWLPVRLRRLGLGRRSLLLLLSGLRGRRWRRSLLRRGIWGGGLWNLILCRLIANALPAAGRRSRSGRRLDVVRGWRRWRWILS